jgi:uncharacterized delta-60 repeat protein
MYKKAKGIVGFLSLVAVLSWGIAWEPIPKEVSPGPDGGRGIATSPKVSWIKTFKAGDEVVDLSVDASGNVFVVGTTDTNTQDYMLVKYDPRGKQMWTARYDIEGGQDNPSAIAVDPAGNAYVTGSSDGWHTYSDFLTVKYKPTGKREWVARLNGAEGNADFANGVAVDGSGNVFVTGSSRSDATDYDIVTVKYNSAGLFQWGVLHIGPGLFYPWRDDVGRYIKTDAAGNVYVAGTSESGSCDIVTIKYDAAGKVIWDARYDGPTHGNDEPKGLAIDSAGNVYVAGNGYSSSSGDDIILIKYDSAGQFQWSKSYTSPSDYPEDAQDIGLDTSGNVYVTGSTNVSGTNKYITLKYSPAGARLWAAKYGYGYGGGAYSLDIDGSGNVYVTGDVHTPKSSNDIVTLKYNPKGKIVWNAVYSSATEDSFDIGRAVVVDPSGAVLVAGDRLDAGWVVIKYK